MSLIVCNCESSWRSCTAWPVRLPSPRPISARRPEESSFEALARSPCIRIIESRVESAMVWVDTKVVFISLPPDQRVAASSVCNIVSTALMMRAEAP